MSLEISVDTGGTHTDAFLRMGDIYATGKAETTPYNLSVGFLKAVEGAAQGLGLSLDQALGDAENIKYSTTVGTNLLIERTGPRLGLITTRGFEETIRVGRSRSWADGLPREVVANRARAQRPEPLIPRERIRGVRERVDVFGNVVMPLQDEDALEQIQALVDLGVRGIVVCLLWSFLHPAHELQIRELIRQEYPETYLGNMPVLLSHEICPRICEYKRSMTSILHAYLFTGAQEHFMDLTDELRARGFRRPFLVVRSSGGLASVSRTGSVDLYAAGPVAGIMGGAYWGRHYGKGNVLVTDMGGTSFDVGMVVEGKERVYDFNPVLDRWRVAIPIIATRSVGAGGGSIARVDDVGRLRVGPQSAGAMPGPACYDKGGPNPTVTDADLLLGYLDPDYFLGGRQRLSAERARRAMRRRVAEPLGVSVEEAAFRVRRLVDGFMGQEIFEETAMKGYDPREFLLLAFGGAGPVHCCGYAAYADIHRIVTFPFGAVFNAFGAGTMDVLQTYEASRRVLLFDPDRQAYLGDGGDFNAQVEALRAMALRDMREEGFDLDRLRFELELDMTYARQIHSTRIVSPRLTIAGEADIVAICEEFNRSYTVIHGPGSIYPEGGIEVTGLKLNAIGSMPRPDPPRSTAGGSDPSGALKGRRPVFWDVARGFQETRVYDGPRLRCGNTLEGPALVEAPDTVCAVPAGWRYTVDEFMHGILEELG